MFNSKKGPMSTNDFNASGKSDTTIIGSCSNFDGTLNTTGIVRVDGVFSGELNVDGNVIIGENGYIKGNIKTCKITIAGKVEGNISSSEVLELTASGKLYGDIEVKNISIEDGGIFQGKCVMMQKPLTAEYTIKEQVDLPLNNTTSVSE